MLPPTSPTKATSRVAIVSASRQSPPRVSDRRPAPTKATPPRALPARNNPSPAPTKTGEVHLRGETKCPVPPSHWPMPVHLPPHSSRNAPGPGRADPPRRSSCRVLRSSREFLQAFLGETTCPVPRFPPRPAFRERAGVRACHLIFSVSRPGLGPSPRGPKSGSRASDIFDLGLPRPVRAPSQLVRPSTSRPRQLSGASHPSQKITWDFSVKQRVPSRSRAGGRTKGTGSLRARLLKSGPHCQRTCPDRTQSRPDCPEPDHR